jgi:SAM-dependent methyltransferase
MTAETKYDRLAERYSEHDYADPTTYARRRAQVIARLGPPLRAGQSVLDLACGDGVMAQPLVARGLVYSGVDRSAAMIHAARARNPGLTFALAELDEYEPPEPVDCTICLRAFYYARHRAAFFARVRAYTRVKLVFDIRPQVYDVDEIMAELHRAGFAQIELRPFLLPQSRALPPPLRTPVYALEASGGPARLVLRRYGSVFCAAS